MSLGLEQGQWAETVGTDGIIAKVSRKGALIAHHGHVTLPAQCHRVGASW